MKSILTLFRCKKAAVLAISFLLFLSIPALAQTPKTLLWKITGNGFTQPCYLYGTMHSQDKRVYYLGDSVYSSLRSVGGFAMEIDPGDLTDTLLNNLTNRVVSVEYGKLIQEDLTKKTPVKRDITGAQQRFDSLVRKLRQRYDDISPRDISRLEKAYRRRARNDMGTLLDLYLFDLAKRQGKIVSGIEDIPDQTSIKDEFGSPFDPDEFLKNQRKKYADIEEFMIDTYAAEDLDKLYAFSIGNRTQKQINTILFNRNNKMSRRIDSLGHIRPTFCAVGAAHLPGDSGVIALLKKRGFTVTPVFSSKKIEPGDIELENQLNALITITDEDSSYAVQMPGKPTILTYITKKLYLKTYKELDNRIMLMCGTFEDGNLNNDVEKEVTEIKSFFNRYDIKLYNSTKITRQELDGYEMNFKNTDAYIKLHIFCVKGKLFMFAAGSKDKDSLNAERCNKFLASYKMSPGRQRAVTEMAPFTDAAKAFKISFPSLPKTENIKGTDTYTKEDVIVYSSLDNRRNVNYLVILKEPYKGYFNNSDSSVIVQTVGEIKKNISATAIATENIILDGLPALKIRIKGEAEDKNIIVYTVMAMRHNRLYTLSFRGLSTPENELLFDQFISSFSFLPYTNTTFKKQVSTDGIFSVTAPSPVLFFDDKNKNSGRTDYYAFDSATAMSYAVTAIKLSPYYWALQADSLLADYVNIHFNESYAINNVVGTDSLVYKKNTANGAVKGRELLIKDQLTNSCTRLRIMHHGDSVFIINIKGAKDLVTNDNANTFFNSFRFNTENVITTAFVSKTALLISDLQSADKNKVIAAATALQNGLSFPAQDLSLLLNALLYNNYSTNNGNLNIPALLAQSISEHANTTVIDFIKNNYPLLKNKQENTRQLMLQVLAGMNSASAYSLLNNSLLTDAPAVKDQEALLPLLINHPALSATLFPSLATKLGDENLGPVLIDVANILIDSNKMEFSAVKDQADAIVKTGRQLYKLYYEHNSEQNNVPHAAAILKMLAKLNQKQSRKLLDDFMELQNYTLNAVIIAALLKNDQPVDRSVTDRYCADPARRIQLYDELAVVGKQAALKGDYISQPGFAEAFARIYTEEKIGETVAKYYEFAQVRDTIIHNTVKRYYIYKITCQRKYGTDYYTCIIGAFGNNNSYLSIKQEDEAYILYPVKYDAKNFNKYFADFIAKAAK